MHEYTILRREHKGMSQNDVDAVENMPDEDPPTPTETMSYNIKEALNKTRTLYSSTYEIRNNRAFKFIPGSIIRISLLIILFNGLRVLIKMNLINFLIEKV